MSAQPLSPLLVRTLAKSEAFTPALSYYRSRLFTPSFGDNTLVTAAQPVFSLLDRLCISDTLPPIEQLRENLEHEIFAFNSRIHNNVEAAEINQMAHFMLCAAVDELVGKNYLRVHQENIEFKAFSNHQTNAKSPQELFFELLKIIQHDPKRYLNLLEFAYFCLISGIEGPFHNKPSGRQSLDELLDDLFNVISQYRSYRSQPRVNKPTVSTQTNDSFLNKKNITWAGVLLLIGLIGGVHYLTLDAKVKSLHIKTNSAWGYQIS